MAASVQSSTIDYSPLSKSHEIRLVVLEQGSPQDPIRCNLVHAELGARKYGALSYEWGEALTTDPVVFIDGKAVQVRANLHDAMMHLRLASGDRHLWIDALCIDQSNVQERNQQVGLMGRIYSEASVVIAWLGGAMDDSDAGMEALKDLGAVILKEGEDRISIRQMQAHDDPSLWDLSKTPITFLIERRTATAIRFLAKRSYWLRMWIIQETQLGTELIIQCGTRSVAASIFLSYQFICKRSPQPGSIDNISDTPGLFLLYQREIGGGRDLYEWLHHCYTQGVSFSEPRDIVYGLLGIAGDCQSGTMRLDYGKSLIEVYGDVLGLFSKGTYHFKRQSDMIIQVLSNLAVDFNFIDIDTHGQNMNSLHEPTEGDLILPLVVVEGPSPSESITRPVIKSWSMQAGIMQLLGSMLIYRV